MADRSNRCGGGSGRPRLIAAAALAQLALAGCYNYTRVEPGQVPLGSDVRVHVARGFDLEPGSVPVEINGGSSVRGKLVRPASADTLFFDVLTGAPVGAPRRAMRSTVSVPMHAVEAVEVRSLDRTRTGGLVLLSAAIAWVVLDASFDIRNPDPPGEDGGGGDNARRIPLLRWRF